MALIVADRMPKERVNMNMNMEYEHDCDCNRECEWQCESQLQRQQHNNRAVELIERVLAGLFNFPSFQFPLPSQVAMHVKQTERSVDQKPSIDHTDQLNYGGDETTF